MSIATSLPINSTPLGVRPTIKPKVEALIKQKHSWSAKINSTSKHIKKCWAFNFLSSFWHCLNNSQKFYLSYVISFCQFDFPLVAWQLSAKPQFFTYLSVFLFRYWPTGFFLSNIYWLSLTISLWAKSVSQSFLVFLYQSPRELEVFD